MPADIYHTISHNPPKMCGGLQKGENPSEFGICNQLILCGEPIFSPASLRGRVISGRVMMDMSDLIDREALLRQIDIDSEGEPGYYGDTWKFIDTIKRMPSALGTNLAEVGTDCISRQQAIKTVGWYSCHSGDKLLFADNVLRQLPPIQPKRGKWILKSYRWECDQCGCLIRRENPFKGNKWNYNFCPNCGSRNEVTT